ncbi:hypothetical protein BDZ97DRAFT_1865113 [Flammula alnicola]|nr:hypothetical protein BDZ97DRAFT_1865113 [Flammula alnicola]
MNQENKANKACRQEFSFLTDRASRGPHQDDANFLRLSVNQVSVSLLEEVKLDDLNSRYLHACNPAISTSSEGNHWER